MSQGSGSQGIDRDRASTGSQKAHSPARDSTSHAGASPERDTLPPEGVGEPQDLPKGDSFSKQVGSLPEQFGRYRILDLLGQGAMGSVYLAHDTELHRKVALKVPKFRESESDETIERFYREARSSATLRNANICPIYDVGEISGLTYITMAYIEGRRLSDYLKSGKRLPERQIALLVRKLALALQEAHDRNVVHRDLKPANIMIDEKHEPIIMDFGLARQMDQTEDERLTQEGMIIGSPAYMSPEQVEGRRDNIGLSCDIYSLGVVLYEMITGQTPFQGSIASIIGQIVSQVPPKPSALRPDVDPRLEAICLKMMAKRIDDRFASMADAASALKDFLKSSGKPGESRADSSASGAGSGASPAAKAEKIPAEDVATLLELGREFMGRHDYAQVIQLLESIPPRQRTNEVLGLLEKATEYQDEVVWLSADIQDAASKNEYEGLLPNVKRLLELKPGHESARELYDKLTGKSTKRAKGRGKRRAKRAKAPSSPETATGALSWLTESAATMALVAFVAFGLMTWGITVYVRSDNQTVVIAIDDSVRAEDVSVSIDSERIDIEGIGETITLKRGDHVLEIKRGDVVVKTQDFQVVKGEKTLLRISLDDGPIADQSPDAKSVSTADGTARQAPPLAVAPFDAGQAKKHQQDWAAYLGVPVEITNSIGMKLVLIPPGEFLMGSSKSVDETAQLLELAEETKVQYGDEHPQHRVRITKPFLLGAHEVTVGQFRAFVRDAGYKTEAERDGEGGCGWDESKSKFDGPDPKYNWQSTGFDQDDRHPVSNVSWNDAAAFYEWLSRKEGKTYRLPTEAEWEYACRAGTTTMYFHGDDREGLARVGNVADGTAKEMRADWSTIKARDGYVFSAPVGEFRPNGFGLFDVHGNVWEWCQDWYQSGYYSQSPTDDPVGPSEGSNRVVRSGGWGYLDWRCRSADRCGRAPSHRVSRVGFRLAVSCAPIVTQDNGHRTDDTPSASKKLPAETTAAKPAPATKGEAQKAPPLAVAPFDTDQAKKHQKDWAAYLGVPVEITNSIGMKYGRRSSIGETCWFREASCLDRVGSDRCRTFRSGSQMQRLPEAFSEFVAFAPGDF